MEPIFPKPNYLPSIWGGTRLAALRGVSAQPGKPIGIAREVCAYPGAENVVESGTYAGQSLRQLIDEHHEELMGDDPETQLIRLAYMDPVEDLSIQVHPGEVYAVNNEHDREKSESWYILEAKPGAYVVAGTTTQDVELLRKAAQEDQIDRYVRKVPVRQGDFVLIPCGMLHACGKDMLAIEVGSFGGITYRICDYGRGRPLHLAKSFDVLDPALQPESHHFAPGTRPASGASVRSAIRHPLFAADIVDIADEWQQQKGNTYQVLTAVEGDAVLVADGRQYPLPYTRTVILPASLRAFSVRGNCRILCSWHPVPADGRG